MELKNTMSGIPGKTVFELAQLACDKLAIIMDARCEGADEDGDMLTVACATEFGNNEFHVCLSLMIEDTEFVVDSKIICTGGPAAVTASQEILDYFKLTQQVPGVEYAGKARDVKRPSNA